MNATIPRYWTRGYRQAWRHFRGGLSWMLLDWALAVLPDDDPDKQRLALALLPLAAASVADLEREKKS